jgi:hypothetical protein
VNTWTRGWTASEGEHLLSAMCSPAGLTFCRQEIPAVRGFAAAFGARAGLAGSQLADFVLAVSEAAACAVSHGPATARLRLRSAGARVLGEVRAEGMLSVYGPGVPGHGDTDRLRRGLLRQICEYVSFDAGPYGVTVRFSVTVV